MRTEHEFLTTTNRPTLTAGAGHLHGSLPDALVAQLAPPDGVLSPSVIEAAHLLVAGTLSPRSRDNYGFHLARASWWCAEHGLDLLDLSPLDVAALALALRDAGRSPKQTLVALSFLYRHKPQPAAGVTALANRADRVWRARFRDRLVNPRRAVVLPLPAWQAMRSAVSSGRTSGGVHAYDEERYHRDRFIISLGVCAGLRPGEFGLLSASRSRISSDGRQLILPFVATNGGAATTKTGRSEIVVPLGVSPFAVLPLGEDFERFRAVRLARSGESDRLVGDAWNYGRPAGLSRGGVTDRLRKLAQQAGISDGPLLGGGSLRRSMVHIAAAAGWTPEQIAAVTGHTSTSVVERFYLDGYAGVWTRSGEGLQMLLEGSDQWATCPLNVDAEVPRPARQPGHRGWWQDRDLEADKVRAMDLARGTPRVEVAARRTITRTGRLWEEFCAHVGADAAKPNRPLIEAFCIELTRGGATGRYRTAHYLTDYFAAHPSIDPTEVAHLESLVNDAVHLARNAVTANRRRNRQASQRRTIVPVTDAAMEAIFYTQLQCRTEGVRLCGVVLAHGEARQQIPPRQRKQFRFGEHTRIGDDLAELLTPPRGGSDTSTVGEPAIVVARRGGDPLWCPHEAARALTIRYPNKCLPQALAAHPWALHCGSVIRWLQGRAAVAVLFATGMRPSDLRGIRWNDLRLGDDGALMWRLPYSKGNKTGDRVQILRLEPTTEPWCPVTALRRLADSLREARSAGWLGTTAQPDSDGIVRRVFPNDIGHDTIRVLLRPAGVDVRCQDFRYRKAAKVWAETRDMQMVRAVLFHREARDSAGYVQRGLSSPMRAELDALSGVFSPK